MIPIHAQASTERVFTTGDHAQRETSAYVTSIDSLRAVAVLSVMIYHMHATWLPGGFAGVDVFFVISGYVISRSMVSLGGLGFASFAGTFLGSRPSTRERLHCKKPTVFLRGWSGAEVW